MSYVFNVFFSMFNNLNLNGVIHLYRKIMISFHSVRLVLLYWKLCYYVLYINLKNSEIK